ncbi:hypothetical protein HYN48_13505 [Flavobacterium magnum]|uniref:Uncharacterized protein n=1 Tax=Flavobacterium magnum TaxID=2162713 RepID=A0A2S0RH84_9FLAO|nr:hypothetical protein [Flavobacterium magnum]AWA31016.1 hypothetical protein HYN48_13505 [Flavobacterium magnum]
MKKILLLLLVTLSAKSFAQPKINFTLKDICEQGKNNILECITTFENNSFSIEEKQIIQSQDDSRTIFVIDSKEKKEKSIIYNVHIKTGEKFSIETYDKHIIIHVANESKKYTLYK